MANDLGNATTITFAGFTGDLLSIGLSGVSRPAVDVSTLGTTTARAFVPSDLYDGGELEARIHWTGTETIPITGASTATTIAWGGTINDTTFNSFVIGFSIDATEGEAMIATVTFKITGAVTL